MSILAFSVPFLFPLSVASEEVQPARATEIRATEIRTAEIRTAEIRAALPSRELQAWMADAGVGEPGLVTHTIPIGDWGEPLPLLRKGKRILSAA